MRIGAWSFIKVNCELQFGRDNHHHKGIEKIMAQFPLEQSKRGEFKRQEDAFRDWVKRDGSTPYKPEHDRYHLYVSLACPWAHRTIILRKLKGLEETIGMTVVDPVRDERGWAFRDGPGHSTDPVNGFQFLSEAYRATDPVTMAALRSRSSGTSRAAGSSATPMTTCCGCSTASSRNLRPKTTTSTRLISRRRSTL